MNSQLLTNLFRDLPTTFTTSERRMKAIATAQVLAYSVTLDPTKSIDELLAETRPGVKTFVSELNESTIVDTALTLDIYERLLTARLDAVMNPVNLTLMSTIMSSEEQANYLNDETRDALAGVLSTQVQSVVKQLVTQPEGE